MFDFPHPFGPTIPTRLLLTGIDTGSTKDLKPDSLIVVKRTRSSAQRVDAGVLEAQYY
jgi:hypothetical protein